MKVANKSALILVLCLVGAAISSRTSLGQTAASGTAGPNLNAPPSQPPIEVGWTFSPIPENSGSWILQMDMIVDPDAGPMVKWFQSPQNPAGGPILLDAQQPIPQILWEDFLILPVPNTPGVPVTDWHEEILTPGWEWVIPGDPRFPTLFPAGSSLITRNGQPWPWTPDPRDVFDPTKLWVHFPPIPPHDVLDVHKALLWVGTPGNRIWGDGRDDSGAPFTETLIVVREHPTIPEPATMWSLLVGASTLGARRWLRVRG